MDIFVKNSRAVRFFLANVWTYVTKFANIQLRRLYWDQFLQKICVQVCIKRKIMKAEPCRLIPRKLAVNLELVIVPIFRVVNEPNQFSGRQFEFNRLKHVLTHLSLKCASCWVRQGSCYPGSATANHWKLECRTPCFQIR